MFFRLFFRREGGAFVDEADVRIAVSHSFAEFVGFLEEEHRVEVNDGDGYLMFGVHVDQCTAFHAEGGGENHACGVEAFEGPGDDVLGGAILVDGSWCFCDGGLSFHDGLLRFINSRVFLVSDHKKTRRRVACG